MPFLPPKNRGDLDQTNRLAYRIASGKKSGEENSMRPGGRPRQTQTSSLQGVAGVIIAQVLFNQKTQQLEATDPALVAAFNEEISILQARIKDLEQTVQTYQARLGNYRAQLSKAKKKLGMKE